MRRIKGTWTHYKHARSYHWPIGVSLRHAHDRVRLERRRESRS